jgi:hypothetical protein
VLALLAVLAGIAFALWSPRLPFVPGRDGATLSVVPQGDVLTSEARVGSTYNIGVPLRVTGKGEIELRSVSLHTVTTGLDTPEPVLAWNCDGNEYWGAVVAADLYRLPRTGAKPLREPRLTADTASCWYLLLPFVPRRLGRLRASGATVTYRSGGRERTADFPFVTAFDVDGTGRDDRDKQ